MASASLWRRVDLILVQHAVRLVRPSIKLGKKLMALSRKVRNGTLKPCIAQTLEVGYKNRNKWQFRKAAKKCRTPGGSCPQHDPCLVGNNMCTLVLSRPLL